MSAGGLDDDDDDDDEDEDEEDDDGGGCAELHGNQDILLYISYIIFCFVGGKRRHCASGEASRSFPIIFRRRKPKEY